MSTAKQPVFKTDEEKNAYRAGLQAGLKPVPTVEQQQRKIAQQIKTSGPVTSTSSQSPPPVDHHPQDAYRSYLDYKAMLLEEGMAPNQDFEHWKRSHFGISTDSDHEKSQQQIHKNNIGGKSVQKGIPDHIHDKIVGKITMPDKPPIPSAGTISDSKPAKGKSPIPSAGTISDSKPAKGTPNKPPIPSAGTISDSKPAKGTPAKDFSRVDSEVSDIDYSPKYRETLAKWSYNNFLRQERGLQPLPRPKPPKEFSDKDTKTLGSEDSPNLDKLLANSKLVLAKDKITPYMLATKSQLPYYLDVDGKREAKLYNRQGNLFDETGPRLTDLGLLGKDLNQHIKEQAWERAFDLVGVLGGATTKAGSAATRVIAQRAGVAASRVRNVARAVGRSRNVGNLSTAGLRSRTSVPMVVMGEP